MAESVGLQVYTHSDLEDVARMAVREALEEAEPERIEQLASRVLREFDERCVSGMRMGYPRSDEFDAGGPHG